MVNKHDRYVGNNPHGGWDVKAPNADRASAHFEKQADAERYGREVVRNLGGGELRVQDRHGQWRDSDTVPHGHDPFPPRDRK